jgi:hypothetical protein
MGVPRADSERGRMKLDTLLRAAQILSVQPACTMPLTTLHACLAAEIGRDAGTYAQMYAELKKRPQSFMVLEAPSLVEDEAYEALTGFTWVTLAESTSEDRDALAMAGTTLTELWARTDMDPALREQLLNGARQLEALLNP